MIRWISTKLLCFVCKNLDIPPEMSDIYQYGIEITISSMFNITLVLFCSMALRDILSGITYLFVFIFLRSFTGGYHASTYFKCNLTIVTTYALSYLAYKVITHFEFPLFLMGILALLNILPIVVFSPVPNKRKAN